MLLKRQIQPFNCRLISLNLRHFDLAVKREGIWLSNGFFRHGQSLLLASNGRSRCSLFMKLMATNQRLTNHPRYYQFIMVDSC